MNQPQATATVIADSISQQGIRLTTFQLRYWRPIHSELMTHREFSRCAGSSRARPSKAIIEQVRDNPWAPVEWGKNQPGMQAKELLTQNALVTAQHLWEIAAADAAVIASMMVNVGAHKQIVNRLLEPFTYIDVVVSSTSYANWFFLRDHEDADPTIRDLAIKMRIARDASTPKLLLSGQWHLPYIIEEDRNDPRVLVHTEYAQNQMLASVSAARCARTSYKAHDGTNTTVEADLGLYDRLVGSTPLHASPTEHQATPDEKIRAKGSVFDNIIWANPQLHGNFEGWIQFRKTHNHEYVKDAR